MLFRQGAHTNSTRSLSGYYLTLQRRTSKRRLPVLLKFRHRRINRRVANQLLRDIERQRD